MDLKSLANKIEIARGDKIPTLLLKNCQVVNVFSGEVIRTNVAIDSDTIVGVGDDYNKAKIVYDLTNKFLLPGFIDGHIHIESSLLAPTEFIRLVVRHGTTTVVADPHEIANVLGMKGIEYILNCSTSLPFNLFVMIPSCVPATELETAGAKIDYRVIKKLLTNPRVLGLAEMMNFPGVIQGDGTILKNIILTKKANKIIDGHAPGLFGRALQAYIMAGIGSEHEAVFRQEAKEKLRAGLRIMIREGSAAHNLADLLPIVNPVNSRRCFFVTDDKHPFDLIKEGHLDHILRKAVGLGLDPITAIQMVTLNPAEYFGLKNLGAIAPGYKADLVVISDLNNFTVEMVFKDGKCIVEKGNLVALSSRRFASSSQAVTKTMKVKPFTIKDLQIPFAKNKRIRVIRTLPNQIVTEAWITLPKVENDIVVPDIERDILKIVVIERHRRTGNIGVGLVQGFGLKKGAIASSVAHDSHNIIGVGTNDTDLLAAVKEVIRLQGGLVIAADNKIQGSLPLPIAGLMSKEKAETVIEKLNKMLAKLKVWGAKMENPFITLSFLALPVIPQLKITDRGLVDVTRFKFVSLWDESG
uniref:Adenine deaminase n=1 Tax=candidate division WOR-3 bacterium TaxID=2052148 RepID=A0A7C6EDB3_UNCW3